VDAVLAIVAAVVLAVEVLDELRGRVAAWKRRTRHEEELTLLRYVLDHLVR
jgi:hypothetical protein